MSDDQIECCQCGNYFDEYWMSVWNDDHEVVDYICTDCHDDIMNKD